MAARIVCPVELQAAVGGLLGIPSTINAMVLTPKHRAKGCSRVEDQAIGSKVRSRGAIGSKVRIREWREWETNYRKSLRLILRTIPLCKGMEEEDRVPETKKNKKDFGTKKEKSW